MTAIAELLTPEEAARWLRISKRTLYEYMRSGELPAIKIGPQWRIDTDELVAFMKRGAEDRR
jgi:excisionase family DNA binding protein